MWSSRCRFNRVMPERVDYEYERMGTANLFVMVERLTGYRHVEVTERRTAEDYARQLQWLADVRYPNAKKIRLVQDNLNTHRLANLYLVFPPEEARRLAERFELHFTPNHGSWLNMAEIEIGIFERRCLRRRVPSRGGPQQRVAPLKPNAMPPRRPLTGDLPRVTPVFVSHGSIPNSMSLSRISTLKAN